MGPHRDGVRIGGAHEAVALTLIAAGGGTIRSEPTFVREIPTGIVLLPQGGRRLSRFELCQMFLSEQMQPRDQRTEGGIGAGCPLGRFVASEINSSPQTRPAAMHCSAMISKKRRKTGNPKRVRILLIEE
jgi:hypothetical protein